MDGVVIFALVYCGAYLSALAYGWCHRDDPFWQGFINPFNF